MRPALSFVEGCYRPPILFEALEADVFNCVFTGSNLQFASRYSVPMKFGAYWDINDGVEYGVLSIFRRT